MSRTDIDLTSAEFSQDPYRFYAQLRRSGGEVWYLERMDSWLVLGHEESIQVLSDTVSYSSGLNAKFDPVLLGADGPEHLKSRKALEGTTGVFSKRRVTQSRETHEAICAEVSGSLKGRNSFDAIRDYAQLISTLVILDSLGVETDRNEEIQNYTFRSVANQSIYNEQFAQEDWNRLKPLVEQLVLKARNHGSGRLSEIVNHPDLVDRLSSEQMVGLLKILLIGGNETTPNLVGSCLFNLLGDAELYDMVVGDMALIRNLVNETLRRDSPTQLVHRLSTRETRLGKQTIPADSVILVSLGAANRDARVFKDPDVFDINRNTSKSIPFGYGPHHCIGAVLAKQEAEVALKCLLTDYPALRLPQDHRPVYRNSSHVRGLSQLPVTVDQCVR